MLDLERIDPWKPGAVIEVDGHRVAPPATVHFRGQVQGEQDSLAILSVRRDGRIDGLVHSRGGSWAFGKRPHGRIVRSRRADADGLPAFACGEEQLAVPTRLSRSGRGASGAERQATPGGDAARPKATAATVSGAASLGSVLDSPRVANIAIETDAEYFARFGDVTAALDYMADLIGYADLTYSRETSTDLRIGFARLWTGGADSDPWTAGACVDANNDGTPDNKPCGTNDALNQLRDYWNANMASLDRSTVHMLSGKALGGGIAWIGALCDNMGIWRGQSYDYGLSASLGAGFSWDGNQAHDPAAVVWDIVVVQHEIGHNFDSPHSHDYCNLGGSALPIDNCWSGCQAGATLALPSCSSPTPWFTSGGGAGTIMSYCHQRTGRYGNIAMTFGRGHTCGNEPQREADQMTGFAAAMATAYPTCLVSSACGNGNLDEGEECDDGNAVAGDGCTSDCRIVRCGDGIRDDPEPCDDGNGVNTDACTTTCHLAACGDGFVQQGVEQCDDGNQDNGDSCLNACLAAGCGDGFVQQGVEQCDDANSGNGDACVADCRDASCGDGFVEQGVEQCDDGNLLDGDGCSAACLVACPASPTAGCDQAGASTLKVSLGASSASGLLQWRWGKGPALDLTDVGDPRSAGANGYLLCFYRNVPGGGSLAATSNLPAGGNWSALGADKGYQYTGSDGSLLRLSGGPAGKPKARLDVAGAAVPTALLPATSVTVQLTDATSRRCWSSSFAEGWRSDSLFVGKSRTP